MSLGSVWGVRGLKALTCVCLYVAFAFNFVSRAEARLATAEDLPSVVELDQSKINVDRGGHARITRLLRIRINNDQGRENESVQTIPFNARATTLKILEARTINGTKKKRVQKKNIEFKEVGDTMNAFDSQKQATIAFPDVRVGSVVELRFQLDFKEVPIEGFWSWSMFFNQDYIERVEYSIHSALPLYVWKNDTKGLFDIKQTNQGRTHSIEIRSLGAVATAVTQEEDAFLSPARSPAITVSTLPNWESYAKDLIPVHEKLLAVPLPAALGKIRDEAAREKTVLDKLQKVTALLSQEFRYFGDWRRRNGGYIPRTLAEIDETRYGDCKDLSLAATAIYRALGLKANMAWVWRGELPLYKESYTLPVDSFFNHAVTRVEAEGKVYWIDATNPVSYARSALADIAGRPAFVLESQQGYLDSIPEIGADSALFESDLQYDLQGDQSLKVAGSLKLSGRSAVPMTIKSFYGTVEKVNYDLIRALAMYGKVLDSVVGDFDRRSRIVSDLEIPVKFTLNDIGLRTSAGLGFPLMREDVISRVIIDTRDRVSDIYLETPNLFRQHIRIANVRRVGRTSLDCELKSAWMNLSRRVTDTPKGVEIQDRIDVLKPIVPNDVLGTPDFAKFQAATRDCFNRAAVILEPR